MMRVINGIKKGKDKEEIPVKRQKEGKRKVIEDKDSENNIMEINEKNNEIK